MTKYEAEKLEQAKALLAKNPGLLATDLYQIHGISSHYVRRWKAAGLIKITGKSTRYRDSMTNHFNKAKK